MEAQPGVVQPQNFPWRKLDSRQINNGQIVNPVGVGDYAEGMKAAWTKGDVLLKTTTGSDGRSASGHLKGR